ncbi:MAG: toxin ParE1/3/4 [Sphingomonadales bacterium]|nr:toxin ParE1/3/4 [Sphingomonadales bacterium]
MYRLEYSEAALADLGEIGYFLARESHSRATADAFTDRLIRHCEKLAASIGTLGVARPDLRADLRSLPFGNYTIFFRYRDDLLEIVNILESHRDVEGYYTQG